jgi:hypothetical protein
MERLGWRLRLAGFKPDVLERMTGIKERRMWEAGTTVVQVRQILDRPCRLAITLFPCINTLIALVTG